MTEQRPANDGAQETANLHLQLLGQEHCVSVPIPQGQQPVTALLPAAWELTGRIMDIAEAAALREGRRVSCCAGCGACCRQLVVISLAEAQALAELVAALPPERQAVIRRRFAEAIARMESEGMLDPREPKGERRLIHRGPIPSGSVHPLARRYFQLKISCPFLEDESCSIHPERPLVCREYLVTSPAERCARLYEDTPDTVDIPLHVGGVMVEVTHQVTDTPLDAVPLVLSLEWAAAHPAVVNCKRDGLALLQTFAAAIDRNCHQPFVDRAT
jgi:Fe-S-cluster containining protein